MSGHENQDAEPWVVSDEEAGMRRTFKTEYAAEQFYADAKRVHPNAVLTGPKQPEKDHLAAPCGQAAPEMGAEMMPLETIEFWADAYSDPASGEHFMGHGMIVTLLREYAALRRSIAAQADAAPASVVQEPAGYADATALRDIKAGIGPGVATIVSEENKGEGDIPLYTRPSPDAPSTDALRDVAAERQRQIEREGWTPEHDDQHNGGELSEAAICYLQGNERWGYGNPHQRWPWERAYWKPKDRRSNLVRAGALILAEIERFDRSALARAKEIQ
jgi:hypothetical protein